MTLRTPIVAVRATATTYLPDTLNAYAVVNDARSLLANGRFLKERFATAPIFKPG
jgi:hypothetical protein